MRKRWVSGILAILLMLFQVAPAHAVETEEAPAEQAAPSAFYCGTSSLAFEEMDQVPMGSRMAARQGAPEVDVHSIMPGNEALFELMPSTGEIKMLVIPVAYPDQPTYRDSFDRKFCEEQLFDPYDPKKPFYEQSVRGFYQLSSYGKLDITGTVMPIYDAPQNSDYYYEDPNHHQALLLDILNSYLEQGIDLSQYDNNKNGVLDAVVIKSLYPYYKHTTCFNWEKKIGEYDLKASTYVFWSLVFYSNSDDESFSSERECLQHEIGHLLGFSDNYVPLGEIGDGVNIFDYGLCELMTNGPRLEYINVYYKILLGWIEPLILTEEDALESVRLCPVESLENPEDLPRAVLLIPENDSKKVPFTEFYLAEYRCGGWPPPGSRDTFTRSPGLVIWHCNTALKSVNFWNGESLEKYYKYRSSDNYLKPVRKSGGRLFEDEDVYGKGDEFSTATVPNSSFYDGAPTGAYLKVEDLSADEAQLQVGFKGPFLPGPAVSILAEGPFDEFEGPTYQFTVTVTAGSDLIPFEWLNTSVWESYIDSTIDSWEDGHVFIKPQKGNEDLGNPVVIRYVPPRYREGMIRLSIPAGAFRYNNKDSKAVKSEAMYVDITRPKITLLGESPQRIQKGTVYVEQGAVVTDNLDPDIRDKLEIDASQVNTAKPGEYAVIYSVTDHAGNTDLILRAVIVEENLPAHLHYYGFEWSGDGTSHWHGCACGDKRDEEAHTVVVESGIPATCTAPGKTERRYCSVCNKILQETAEIPVIDHSYGEKWEFHNTAHWRECTMCGAKTDVSGHSKFIKKLPAVPATCTDAGTSQWYGCEICGKVVKAPTVIEALGHDFSGAWFYDDSCHWQKCTRCGGADEAAAHIENDGVVTSNPTLEAEGAMTYSCTVCGQVTRTEVLPKLEPEHTHSYGTAWIGDEAGHWHECVCGDKSGHTAHDPVTAPAIPATCTVEGKTEGSHCGECGYVIQEQDAVPALGHAFSGDWTGDETCHWHGCSRCDEISDVEVHTEDDGAVTTEPTLEAEGVKIYSCTVCGQVTRTKVLPKLEPEHTHSYGDKWEFDAAGHWHTCECGGTSTPIAHTEAEAPAVPATCTGKGKTEGKYCPVCGYVISAPAEVPAMGHNYFGTWNSDGANHWQACSECGNKENAAPHDWDGGAETTAPTSTREGVKTYTCTVCARTRTETIPATGDGSGSSGGSSGGGETVYSVSVPTGLKGGKVKADPQRTTKGETVTLTVEAASGYTLEQLSAKDKKGNVLSLEHRAGDQYTFTMPASKVTVEAAFAPKPTETEKPQETKPAEPEKPSKLKPAETRPPEMEKPALPFTDVKEDAWYYNAVADAYHRGLMTGVTESLFMPEAPTTRGMVVTILYRIDGAPTAKSSGFSDVPDSLYCAPAIAWAVEQDITKGCGDGTFRPDDPITREELAVILYRYESYKGRDMTARANLSGFTDAERISKYAEEAMSWAKAAGLISGTDWGGLHPGGRATRAETAAILERIFSLA